jgi:uncharacterized protein (TIGR02246 family)
MRIGLAVLLGAALACAKAEPPPPPPPPAIDSAGVTQAAADLWNRYATADTTGNVDAVLALYTDDARLDIQGMPPIVGRAALDSVIRPMSSTRRITAFSISPVTTLVVSNDLVLQGGTFMETFVENKKMRTEYGRFASSIAHGADGQWRIAYLMGIIDSTVGRK